MALGLRYSFHTGTTKTASTVIQLDVPLRVPLRSSRQASLASSNPVLYAETRWGYSLRDAAANKPRRFAVSALVCRRCFVHGLFAHCECDHSVRVLAGGFRWHGNIRAQAFGSGRSTAAPYQECRHLATSSCMFRRTPVAQFLSAHCTRRASNP